MDDKVKTNKTTSYALMAIGYIAQHYQEGRVTVSVISKEYNIPLLYLFKVLEKLTKANILRSKKGKNGGFILARPAKEISLLEILEAVDGPMFNPSGKFPKSNLFNPKMEEIFQKAREQYHKVKLSDMIKK